MASILIVDDEEGIREFLADALTVHAHEVHQATNGIEALVLLRARAFDLLITDLKMPGALSGIDLLREAKSDQPDVEVIVLTAHSSVDSAVEAMKLGAYDYLEKPLGSPETLRLLVARALERHRLVARVQVQRETRGVPPLTFGDPAMQPVMTALNKVASTNATVLLLGESGTGKELAARYLHARSRRAGGPLVIVNCAAITDSLMESEIFGHERGAFTGATATRRGRVELADGGTVFLDEIGELRPDLQAKLLRVLQDRRFERVGGSRTIEVDVRWIAATNRDLEASVASGGFREDLYHRLAGFAVRLPPLRARRVDILPLAESLLARATLELGRAPMRLDETARERIRAGAWRGNVRELANALERAAILADGDVLRGEDLLVSFTIPTTESVGGTMDEIERAAIQRALADVAGNRRRAAELLGIGERTLYDRIKRYGLT